MALIIVSASMMLMIPVAVFMIKHASDFALTARQDKIIELCLIDAENMNVQEVNEDNTIKFLPDEDTASNLQSALYTNLYSNNLSLCHPIVELEQVNYVDEYGQEFILPEVNVRVANYSYLPTRFLASVSRVIEPDFLSCEYVED